MAISQKELLEKMNCKNWVSSTMLQAQFGEDRNLLITKLNKLFKFGFIERKENYSRGRIRTLGAKSYLWRRLKDKPA